MFIDSDDEMTSTFTVGGKTVSTLERLGKGAFGAVYLAHYSDTPDQKFALKEISMRKTLRVDAREEHSIHSKLFQNKTDGNILKIFGIEEIGMSTLLFMDYIPSGDLSQKCSGNPMDSLTAHNYFKQLIDGLEYIHESGYIHRDIKPQNLLVTSSNVIKITDFGLATQFRFENEERLVSGWIGTPAYWAPQVYLKSPIEAPPLDIWASGLVLLNMVTGKLLIWEEPILSNEKYSKWLNKVDDSDNAWNEVPPYVLGFLRTILNSTGISTIQDIKKQDWYVQAAEK
uniref:Protein kinase domain-containing protein n=1 Tax=Caenorhabditis tropicalis TaxID=1561998 RepID=A0A1I7TLJ7_9PELO